MTWAELAKQAYDAIAERMPMRWCDETHRALVYSRGRTRPQKGPGLILTIPLIQRVELINVTVGTTNSSPVPVVDCDNTPIIVYPYADWRIIDCQKYIIGLDSDDGPAQVHNRLKSSTRNILVHKHIDTIIRNFDECAMDIESDMRPHADKYGYEILEVHNAGVVANGFRQYHHIGMPMLQPQSEE